METIIGFVAGYLVGANGGKGGLERLRSSVQAIKASPELRRLVAEATVVAQGAIGQASKRGLGETISGVTDLIAARAAVARDKRAA